MTYDALTARISAVLTHALATGAALTPTLDDIAIGLPIPRGRCVRIHWDGEQSTAKMGNDYTLNSQMLTDRIVVTCWWPVSSNSEDQTAQIVREMYEFKHEFRTRILGDSQLGGQSTDLTLEFFTPDFQVDGATLYAVMSAEILPDFTEYSIAP